MRDRLIELISQKQEAGWRFVEGDYTTDVLNFELADHLLANGVIVPPCKVGNMVWWVTTISDMNGIENRDILVGQVISFSLQKDGLWAYCRYEDGLSFWHKVADYFGKTVFLTREAAEQALKGGVE